MDKSRLMLPLVDVSISVSRQFSSSCPPSCIQSSTGFSLQKVGAHIIVRIVSDQNFTRVGILIITSMSFKGNGRIHHSGGM